MSREQIRLLVLAIVVLGLVYPVWYTYAVLLPHIDRDLGWGRATVAGGLAVLILTHALTGPLASRLVDRFGTRPVLRIGAAALGLGLLGASRVISPWQLPDERADRRPGHDAGRGAGAGPTLRGALGRRQFWFVFLAFFGFSFGVQLLQAHQVAPTSLTAVGPH